MGVSRAAFVALVSLVALQRVAELRRSRRHVVAASGDGRAVVREPMYAAMVAVHAGGLIGAVLEVVWLRRPLIPALAIASLAVLLAAQLARLAVFRALGGAWSVRVVRPGRVATSGPYRWVRHPNYAIVCAELVALPLVHSAWITAAISTLANAWVLSRRIPLEESVLARDPAWRAAFERLPRLIPGRPRA